MKKVTYVENGVTLSKASLKAGEEVELKYNGLLKNAGAMQVKAHLGYNEDWQDAETYEMTLINDSFVTRILLKNAGTLNCAFVDPVGNWDNNSGANYSFKVLAAKAEKAVKVKDPTEKKASKAKKDSEPEKNKVEKATRKPRSGNIAKEVAASAPDALKVVKPKRASIAVKEAKK